MSRLPIRKPRDEWVHGISHDTNSDASATFAAAASDESVNQQFDFMNFNPPTSNVGDFTLSTEPANGHIMDDNQNRKHLLESETNDSPETAFQEDEPRPTKRSKVASPISETVAAYHLSNAAAPCANTGLATSTQPLAESHSTVAQLSNTANYIEKSGYDDDTPICFLQSVMRRKCRKSVQSTTRDLEAMRGLQRNSSPAWNKQGAAAGFVPEIPREELKTLDTCTDSISDDLEFLNIKQADQAVKDVRNLRCILTGSDYVTRVCSIFEAHIEETEKSLINKSDKYQKHRAHVQEHYQRFNEQKKLREASGAASSSKTLTSSPLKAVTNVDDLPDIDPWDPIGNIYGAPDNEYGVPRSHYWFAEEDQQTEPEEPLSRFQHNFRRYTPEEWDSHENLLDLDGELEAIYQY